jgi:tetratricopeptide (TPR) repeat protein
MPLDHLEKWLGEAGYSHHCFISWPHHGSREISDCAWYLKEGIENRLRDETTAPSVFLDETNITVGDVWPETLRRGLCGSVTMVAILAPLYYHPAEIGDSREEGYALGNLGVAYADLGENQRAIDFFQQQLTIVREIGDRRGEGNALGNLGLAYWNLGETERATVFWEQQLTIARELGDRRSEGLAVGNLGIAYMNLGKTRRAIELYKQRLDIAREIGDRRGEGMALWYESLALHQLGERAHAIQHAEKSLTIFEQIEDPNTAKVRAQLDMWREETN